MEAPHCPHPVLWSPGWRGQRDLGGEVGSQPQFIKGTRSLPALPEDPTVSVSPERRDPHPGGGSLLGPRRSSVPATVSGQRSVPSSEQPSSGLGRPPSRGLVVHG